VLVDAVNELVDAVNELAEWQETPAESTITSLETKLKALLADGEGIAPTVEIDSRDNELTLQLELGWTFKQVESLNIDLKEIIGKRDDPLVKTLVPNHGDFLVEIQGGLKFQLGVGVECSDTGVTTYILGGTGLTADFYMSGEAQFDASIGPLSGSVEGQFSVGDSDAPLLLSVSLGNKSILEDPISSSIDRLVGELEAVSNGSLAADIEIKVPILGGSGASINFTINNLVQFSRDPVNAIDLTYTPTGQIMLPSLFQLLLLVQDTFVDALDDVLGMIEAATFGSKGAITRLRLPFIGNGVGSALGASTDGNIFGQARRKVVFKLKETLGKINPLENDADSLRVNPSENVADILRELLQEIVEELDLSLGEEFVSVECFGGDGNTVSCLDDTAKSVMWTIPFGQEFEEELPLDFSLVSDFPFEVSLGGLGSPVPSLKCSWRFNLAFGFDEEEGFFLYTFPKETDDSELAITALLSVKDQDFKASLFYLTADTKDFDLIFGAGIFVDLVKGAEQPGLQDGRVTRSDFRRIRDITSLFEIGALAGAALHAPNISLAFRDGDVFEKIEDWIPQLELELAAQFREEIGSVGNSDRAYIRRQLLGHPAQGLLRSLAATDPLDILDEDFSFEPCPVNASVASACAKITNVVLLIDKVKDLVKSILGNVANGVDGYLDDIVGPLQKLNEPIPGISDITQKDITVLDVAEIFIGEEKSGADTVRKILKIYEEIQSLFEKFGEGNLLLASECDLLNDFCCIGGLSDTKNCNRRKLLQHVEETLGGVDSTYIPSASVALNDRRLECGPWDFTCLKDELASDAERVDGLQFPVLTDPLSILNLLRGEDIVSNDKSLVCSMQAAFQIAIEG